MNLHYLRSDDDYDGWNVWFWTDGDGSSYKFDEGTKDDKGVVTTITLPPETIQLGFIIDSMSGSQKIRTVTVL